MLHLKFVIIPWISDFEDIVILSGISWTLAMSVGFTTRITSTWAALATRYDQTQLVDLVFTVGQYTMVSMALNSLGVQLEPEFGG